MGAPVPEEKFNWQVPLIISLECGFKRIYRVCLECDMWLEVQMTEYLGWIQNLEDHYEYVMVQEGR